MNPAKKISVISFLIFALYVCVCFQLHIVDYAIAQQTSISNPANNVPADQIEEGGVIGHIQTRDKTITIRSGSDGPLYTVKSVDGKVLAVDLSLDDLYAEFPDLKEIVENGLAGDDASLRLDPVQTSPNNK